MVQLEDAVLARLDKEGHHFEIWVDPEIAWDYKHGKHIKSFRDMIALDTVYSDAKQGDEVKHEFLKEIFGTDYFRDIAKKIIKEGEVQLTTSQRNKMLEKRKQEIIDFIAKNAHDPKKNTPIPPQRIKNALDNAKYKFSLSRKKEDEIHEVLLILKKAFPISLEKINVKLEIPPKYAGKVQPLLHKYDIVNEEWLPSGTLVATLKIPSGLKNALMNDFNNRTHGQVSIKFEK